MRRISPARTLIAVVDSGYRRKSSDPRVLPTISLVQGPSHSAGDDFIGHGTGCIQTILRIAPESLVLPIKIFDRSLDAQSTLLCEAIGIARRAGAALINLSLTPESEQSGRSIVEHLLIRKHGGQTIIASDSKFGTSALATLERSVLAVALRRTNNEADNDCRSIRPNVLVIPRAAGDITKAQLSLSLATAMVTGHAAKLIATGTLTRQSKPTDFVQRLKSLRWAH